MDLRRDKGQSKGLPRIRGEAHRSKVYITDPKFPLSIWRQGHLFKKISKLLLPYLYFREQLYLHLFAQARNLDLCPSTQAPNLSSWSIPNSRPIQFSLFQVPPAWYQFLQFLVCITETAIRLTILSPHCSPYQCQRNLLKTQLF